MTNSVSVSALFITSALAIAASLPAYGATPSTYAMTVSYVTGSGAGAVTSTVTITADSTGLVPAVTFSSPCNNCSTTSVLAAPGTLTWTGTIGIFNVNGLVGQTKGLLPSPQMDVGTGLGINGSVGGTLTVAWTDTGFSGTDPENMGPSTNYVTGSGTTNYYLYVDNTNAQFGQGTLAASLLSTGTGDPKVPAGAGILKNPFSMTLVEQITLNPDTSQGYAAYSNDYSANGTPGSLGGSPTPSMTLTKSVVGSTTVNPFTKVTYKYVVTNTGNTTLTDVTVVDDNATPAYTGDDFTVPGCSNLTLTPAGTAGASVTCTASVYPPVSEGANDSGQNSNWGWSGWGQQSYSYNNIHPGGTLICKSLSNGDVRFTYLIDQSTADNTYGYSSSSDWGWWGNQFGNQLNASAEFQVIDGAGNNVLDFTADYLSPSRTCASGYATAGCLSLSRGSYSNIVSIDTSASHNLNQSKAFSKCTTNSPPKNVDWQNQCAYTVEVSSSAWGSKGFGGIACPNVNHNPKNQGCNQHVVKPCNSTATNIATLTAMSGTTVLMPVTAKATVTINAQPQSQSNPGGWSKANCF